MDVRDAVINFVEQAKDIHERLRSGEAAALTRADLHILEVQLYLLQKELSRAKDLKPPPKISAVPSFPPFDSDEDNTGTS
jgi:hypothetical protein